jgi:hypothetical protein
LDYHEDVDAMRRYRFNPDRVKPRTAAERLARRRLGGVLKMLDKCIREDRKAKRKN